MPRAEKVGPGHPYYERQLESNKQFYQRNKDQYKNRNLLNYYGITLEEYHEKMAAQGFECLCCGVSFLEMDTKKIHLDHDHSCCPGTKTCGQCLRGIICSGCNRALGFIDDDPEKAVLLHDYIISFRIIKAARAEGLA